MLYTEYFILRDCSGFLQIRSHIVPSLFCIFDRIESSARPNELVIELLLFNLYVAISFEAQINACASTMPIT